MNPKIIIGLGNPGRKYEGTRHNVGFEVLDVLAQGAGAEFTKHLKWNALVAKIPGAMLMKPMTFMNESGQAAGQALRFYKWQPSEALVVYDDVHLDVGALRLRMRGSAGGHNGMKSLIQHLGSEDFPRLKLGVGGAAEGELVGHVLGKFAPDEKEAIELGVQRAAEAVKLALQEDLAAAATQYNANNANKD